MSAFVRQFSIILIAISAISACRRPKAEHAASGPAASSLSMEAEAPAEAEVTASSGAIRITLRAFRTKIRKTESLWLQVRIANVSSEPLMVRDEDYSSLMALVGQDLGLSLRLQDEAGRDATARLDSLHEGHVPLDCMRPEDRARWEAALRPPAGGGSSADVGVVWLKAGESVATPSLGYQSGFDRYCAQKPPPKSIAPFAEFAQVRSLAPGHYRLLASYDLLPKPGGKSYPGDVAFKLPLSFEVLP